VLIQLGLMSATDVYQALSKQAVEKIVECFAAERVELSFDEMESLPAAIEPLAVPAFPALLVECVKRHFSEDEQSALLLPIAGARMKLRDPAPELKLKGEDARLAASLNGTRSISEVWRGNASARATLAALALLDVLEPVTTHAKAPAPGPTQAPRASLQFTREVITPRKKQPVTASSVVAKAVAANPNETTQVRLGGEDAPASAGRGSEAKARLEAEQHFQSARKLVEREKFDEAAHAMQRAVALRPGEPEYRMFEAWVSYLAARVGARIARAKAVACARKMIEADPRAAKPHAILGRLLLEDGDAKSAEREFEFALVRDPADDDAKKGITQVRGKSK
jgi:tetratricopeptide (TPR) repeat protein